MGIPLPNDFPFDAEYFATVTIEELYEMCMESLESRMARYVFKQRSQEKGVQ